MKIGAIIQARHDSRRLPGKVRMDLPLDSGISILGHIIKRLQLSNKVDDIILATSDQNNDDPIAIEGSKYGTLVFRGSKDNVLNRYKEAMEVHDLDIAIRYTGDNPLILLDALDSAIDYHLQNNNDYTRNLGLPYGMSFEIINKDAIFFANENCESQEEAEHVTLFIKNNKDKFKIGEFQHHFNQNLIAGRFTVDYPSDYAMMNVLFLHLQKHEFIYDLNTIVKFISKNPWLLQINNTNQQKRTFKTLEEELEFSIEVLTDIGNLKSVEWINQHRTY